MVRRAVVVILLDQFAEYEPVAVARYGADVDRIARIVLERPPQCPDRLAQRAVGHDDVRPDAIEDLATLDRLAAVFDEEDEQIEVARNQRELAARTGEGALTGREREVRKPIAWQDPNVR